MIAMGVTFFRRAHERRAQQRAAETALREARAAPRPPADTTALTPPEQPASSERKRRSKP